MKRRINMMRMTASRQMNNPTAIGANFNFAAKPCRWFHQRRFIGAAILLATLGSSVATAQFGLNYQFAVARYNTNGSLDNTFDVDGRVITDFPGSTYEIAEAVAMQKDGKIVTAGSVVESSVKKIALARYHKDGTLDASFDFDGRLTTAIWNHAEAQALVIQGDGKIVVGGRAISSLSDSYWVLARYNTNGSLDATFDFDGKVLTNFSTGSSPEQVYGLAIQPDGKLVATGYAVMSGAGVVFALARYNSNGSLDATFDGDGKVLTNFSSSPGEVAWSIALQTNGKIVAAGHISVGVNPQFALARYNTNGSLDLTFDGDGKVTTDFSSSSYELIFDVTIQPSDGKIVAGGSARISGYEQFALARYNTNGSLDATFDGDGKVLTNFVPSLFDAVYDVAVQTDGRIVAAGLGYNLGYHFALARYNTNGSLDNTFDGDGLVFTAFTTVDAEAYAMALQPDGKIVAAGGAGSGVLKSAAEKAQLVSSLPENYALRQNFPNPFNPTTSITFELKEAGWTTLKIFNYLGQEIATLADENLAAGQHVANFNAAGLPSGVYFYRLSVNGFSEMKRMEVIK